ncbi:hypothetical protein NBRC116602_10580 [Hyphomicrobiales bacterium 4NK60-0047b]
MRMIEFIKTQKERVAVTHWATPSQTTLILTTDMISEYLSDDATD